MFKKPRRNFRASRKTRNSDSEDEEANGSAERENQNAESNKVEDMELDSPDDSVVVKKPKKKKREKSEAKKTVTNSLSFGDDVDGDNIETFKIKKSSSSRRIAKQMKRESQREQNERERREEEERRRREEALRRKSPSPPVQKGRSPTPPRNGSVRYRRQLSDSGDEQRPGFSDEDMSGSSGDEGGNKKFHKMLKGGAIPDANMIHQARKQRQMARERGDYIPLEEQEPKPPEKNTARLVREEDHDLSEDEEERINFTVDGREKHLRHIQTTILAAQEENHSDQETEWEEQQIKKGVSMPQVQLPPSSQETTYQQYLYTQSANIFNPTGTLFDVQAAAPPQPPPSSIMPNKPLTELTIGNLKKSLQDRLDSIESVHRAHEKERDDMVERLETCKITIEKCEKSKPQLEKQSRFFQEMQGYIRDLVDCINEKVPQIEYMERCMNQILRQRAERLTARRQEDVKDQAADYTAAKLVPLGTQVNSIDSEKQRRAAEREARRARRRRNREAHFIRDHNEGMSTDDEENNTEQTKFNVERDRLAHDSQTIFDDVVEDFHNLDAIKEHFEAWKTQQQESYEEAYIGLCLPKLFTPFVKLRLIDWNPLQGNASNFEEMSWFETLMFYGFLDSDHGSADDADIKLLPSLIEKVLLPKITGLVENVYDPLSSHQTVGLVNVLQRLILDYPTVNAESKHTQALMKAVVVKLRKTLDDDVFIPLYPKQMLENKSSCQFVFHSRQFWGAVKLLGNILQWHGILSSDLLRELSLDCLLNRYIVFSLMNSPINADTLKKCEVIVKAIPGSWIKNLESDKTMPQFENLCRFLLFAAEGFHTAGQKNQNMPEAREQMKRIGRLLQRINARDHCSTLVDKYSIKL